ncbi:MAG: hypothetical protein LLF92_00325 [Planctomycetaceae bacterium]|nr:hypothetical protein [Planctomycetaceae bacterium]
MTYFKLLAVVFVIIFISSPCFSAPGEPMQQREPSARQQAVAERRQQFEQEASAAGPEIDTQYAKFVAYVNSGKAPDDANVREGLKFITKYRRYLPVLNKQNNGGTYYALSAWVMHFDNKPDRVQKQIASGIKDKAFNSNFIHTALALSILNKDYNSVEQISSLVPKLESTDSAAAPMDFAAAPSENTLHLDVNGINTSLLGKDFSALTMGKDKVIISALLWQIDANELEHFAPPAPKPEEPNKPNDPNNPEQLMEQPQEAQPSPPGGIEIPSMPPGGPGMPGAMPQMPQFQQPGSEENYQAVLMPDLTAFAYLNKKFSKNPKAVFLGINFNDPSKTKNVENWLAKNTQAWQCIAPSETIQQITVSLLGQTPKKTMLIIAGPDMKIRYVGDVNNFLPAMIIQSILSNPQEFAEPNLAVEANEPNKPAAAADSNARQKMDFLKPTPQDANAKTVPAASNTTQTTPAANATTPLPQTLNNDNGEYTEVDAEAQQQLSYAEQFFKIANRMQYRSYRKPIEICRSIITKFPNTKYAEQARVLLRQVPERFRGNYNITDAELGL